MIRYCYRVKDCLGSLKILFEVEAISETSFHNDTAELLIFFILHIV